jgi:hypothetical protein
MYRGFLSIAEIINKEPGLEKLRKAVKQHNILNGFHNIFPELKKIAAPVKIEKKVLCLKVANAAWRSELKFNQQTIVDKINTFYGEEIITAVKFQA